MQDVCSEPDRYSSARFRLATARVWARLGFTWFLTPPGFYRPAMEIIFLVRNVIVLIKKCIALEHLGVSRRRHQNPTWPPRPVLAQLASAKPSHGSGPGPARVHPTPHPTQLFSARDGGFLSK